MAKKVLSIDISRTLTKVCEVDFKSKNSKVYQCFTIQTPSGVYEDGFLVQTEEFGAYLRDALKEHGIQTKQAVFTIASSRIANREVLIPFVKEKQIDALVKSNASEYFPVDLTGYQVAYNVLSQVEKEGVKQHKLLVLAVPKPLLESYYELASHAGLSVVALDYTGNSIVPVVKRVCGDEVTMIIKVDETTTMLTVLKNKSVALQRNLNTGADVAIETMMDQDAFGEKLTFSEALEILRGKTCIRKTFDETAGDDADEGVDNDDEKYRQARIELTDSLRGLVSGIVRVVDYYNSRNSEEPIQKFWLTGFGGDFSGLSKLLSHEIDSKVTVLSHIDGIVLSKTLEGGRTSFGEYIACVGAAIDPMDLIPDEHNEKKKKSSDNSNAGLFVALAVMTVGFAVAAYLAVSSIMALNAAKAENERLSKLQQSLQPALEVYNDYNKAQTLYGDVTTMYDMTQSSNENIVDFLQDMQVKMPSSIAVETLVSTKDAIAISMQVGSESDMGKVIEQLRSFESVKDVSYEGGNEEINELGEKVWKFTVTAFYNKPETSASLQDVSMQGGSQTTEESGEVE